MKKSLSNSIWLLSITATLLLSCKKDDSNQVPLIAGGALKASVLSTDFFFTLNSISFIDSNTGWAAGNLGRIVHTVNGGNTWATLTTGTSNDIGSVFFVAKEIGWVAGENGMIKKTVDGGVSWTSQNISTTEDINCIYFIDKNTGWAVGNRGKIFKTVDAGTVWSAQQSNTVDDIYSIQAVDYNLIYACGEGGLFLRSTDGGNSWANINTGTLNDLAALHAGTNGKVYVCGENGTILSMETGNGFKDINPSSSNTDFTSIVFISGSNGYVISRSGDIYQTGNAGFSWVKVPVSGNSGSLYASSFPSGIVGYVAGSSGTVIKIH
jgi:photosystem II stability/assembly factor-like uncharacterized protein